MQRTILAVEDESIVAEDIREMLEGLNYQVELAYNAEEGYEQVRTLRPDLVLMDIMLGSGPDGIELAERIRRQFNIPVIFLTAYADDATLQRAKIVEPYGYILKPFKERELHTLIEISLYKHQAEEQIKANLREKEILLREIHHRVNSNLQLISSMLSIQAEYVDNAQTMEMFRSSQERVESVALVHDILYRSRNLDRIDFGRYISELIEELINVYAIDNSKIHFHQIIKNIELNIDTAINCAVIINELVINAIKHAFDEEGGNISISMSEIEDDQMEVLVKDDGKGMAHKGDLNHLSTLGFQLISSIVQQMNGKWERLDQEGTAIRVVFKELMNI